MLASVFLIGLVGFGAGPVPSVQEVHVQDDVGPAGVAVTGKPALDPPARAPLRDQPSGQESPSLAGPCLPVQFRVKTRLKVGSAEANYSGSCAVRTLDGAELALAAVSLWPRQCRVEVPLALPALRFAIPGYRPMDRDLPPPREGVRDVGTLVFEPDAALQIEVVGGPSSAKMRCAVRGPERFYTVVSLELAAGRGQVAIPAPSGSALQVEVDTESGVGHAIRFPADQVTLAADEVHTLVFDVAALDPSVIRVVGPSRELLPHLQVRCLDRAAPGAVARVRLDAEGRAVLRGVEASTHEFELGTVNCLAALRRRGDDVGHGGACELEPEQALVGLRLRGEDGAGVPFALCLRPEDGYSATAEVAVATAAQVAAAGEVTASTEAFGVLRWPPGAICWRGDVGDLDVAAALRRARLVLTVTGAAPAQAWRLGVRLTGADGKPRHVARTEQGFVFDDLEGGDYSLRWWIADQPGPVIAASVALAAGATQAFAVPWPQTNLWHGEVARWSAIPIADRMPIVRFGGTSAWSGTSLPLDEDGRFELVLPDGAVPPATVTFQFSAMLRTGQVLSLDPIARTLVVEQPSDLRFVEVEVRPRFGGTWQCYVTGQETQQIWTVLNSLHRRVLVPERGVLSATLMEGTEGVTTAWFTIDGTQSRVVIAPTGGHWCELVLERDVPHLGITLIDDRGVRHGPDERSPKAGTVRVWLPESIARVELDLQAAGVQTFAATASHYSLR